MLDVAHMAIHVGQMTGRDAMRTCFAAVTTVPAGIMELDGYGLAPGCHADLVILQARDPIEAIRLRPPRLYEIRRGRVISETAPRQTALSLDRRPAGLDPAAYAPAPSA